MAADRDGDEVTMVLEGLDGVGCGCVEVTELADSGMKSFAISVDTMKITEEDAGTYQLKVYLSDPGMASPSEYETSLKITCSGFP